MAWVIHTISWINSPFTFPPKFYSKPHVKLA